MPLEPQKLSRRIRSGRFDRRQSVADSIGTAPTTLLINMAIEVVSALILLFGMLYLIRFLFMYRPRMDDMHFTFFLAAVALLGAGWGTHVVLKLRTYVKSYRDAVARRGAGKRPTAE